MASIIDQFTDKYPNARNSFDIFKGEWSSAVPGFLNTGELQLFSDHRIEKFEQCLGTFAGKNILELGPLEGAHTAMMSQRGALRVTSIEANLRAFLKCLIVKDALSLSNVKFLHGDFLKYLADQNCPKYDFILSSGVLYHMENPVQLLVDITRNTRSIGIWTHVYDECLHDNEDLKHKFSEEPDEITYKNFTLNAYEQKYLESLEIPGFSGGSAPGSYWLKKEDIYELLNQQGFEVTELDYDEKHQNGPCVTFFAQSVV